MPDNVHVLLTLQLQSEITQHYLVAMKNTEQTPMPNIADFLKPGLLKTNGPGLVSGFHVTSNFDSQQYNSGSMKGIIAGGKVWYILQNWWKTKANVEVEIAYLAASECLVHFVTEKQHRMGDFLSNYKEMVECEVDLDASKNFEPEHMH
ncbi:hypothetical protein CcCBS67573_g04447 [Chytriomyces confervae]|uniref:Uncharacterized protein n=1 Tax=Chytriomyces confervae TaxID=246404 RepID=A0A507FD58_9FUNG|nr:hypothetical protein CcCBS67573_g04447 [Chytriomyces confervae]